MTFQQPDTQPARYGIIGAEVDHENIYNGEWFTWGEAYYAWRCDMEHGCWRLRCIRYGNEKMSVESPPRIDGRTIYRVEFPDEATAPTPEAPSADVVERPAHYARFKIEPLTFIMENDLSFEVGSTVKYVVRAGHKIYDGMTALESKLTDLKKARRMIDMQIGKLTGNPVY